MAAGSVDDIFVEIEVRLDRLETGLRNAEQVIGSSTQRMNRATRRVGEGFGGISSNVQRALLTLGALHISLGTVESLTNVASAGFRLWSADIEDTRSETENLLQALDSIPEIGTAFAAGRRIGSFFRDFSIEGFKKFFEREADPILADLESSADRFLRATDKIVIDLLGLSKRSEFALRVGAVTGPEGLAANREVQILNAINNEERIRLKFVFQREDLERKIFELQQIATRTAPTGEISPLFLAVRQQIFEFEQQILELIAAREREALRKRRRGRDPTESFITAAGTATFGVGAFSPQPALDPPTKQVQERQLEETKRTNLRIDNLKDLLGEIGFQ